MNGSAKIQARHRERQAVVYLRQSSPKQVLHHRESRERQYALVERAVALGWPRQRVLVIDDQEFTRDLVAAILRRANADANVASSVREGLEQFDATSPDVVICDLAMPEEDGFAFLGAIRASPRSSKVTRVIALTAFSRPEDRQHALAAGFDGYLKKPVDPEELAMTVLRLSKARQ